MRSFQVTLGSGATQVLPPELVASSTNTPTNKRVDFQFALFQNNSAHPCRLGSKDTVSSTSGIVLAAGSTTPQVPCVVECPLEYAGDLSDFWLVGTQGDVIDVLYL